MVSTLGCAWTDLKMSLVTWDRNAFERKHEEIHETIDLTR